MTSSYGYGVLEQALAVSAFAVGPWTTAADQCDANYYADGRSAAVLRYSSASAITVERSTTAAHSDASWQHCSPTTGACLATMAPSLPGGHHHTASSAAVRRLWQQRCPHRTAARPLALPSRQRCVHCCATHSVGAARALHQGSARASGASGQRQRPAGQSGGAARGHTHSKIERESGHKRGRPILWSCAVPVVCRAAIAVAPDSE